MMWCEKNKAIVDITLRPGPISLINKPRLIVPRRGGAISNCLDFVAISHASSVLSI